MDDLQITCVPALHFESWDAYASIPISFWVRSRLILPADASLPALADLTEEPVTLPYVKDYDQVAGEGPARWRNRFDLSNWAILQAFIDSTVVGGAVIAWNTPGVNMLEGRQDLAVLWDLRVHPHRRGHGVGHRIFQHAERWAIDRYCRELKIETQNINVPACRFYARQGCTLQNIIPDAYPDLPDEAQMLWLKTLRPN